MDVKLLYLSILRKDGLEVCQSAFSKRTDPLIPTEVIKRIKLILDNNNFEFKGTHYQYVQIDGTVLGSRLTMNYVVGDLRSHHIVIGGGGR